MATYQEIAPSPSLADRIECYWVSSSDPIDAGRVSTVLPDGCMDIIFDLGDISSAGVPGRPTYRSYVVGTMRRPLEVALQGRIDLIGIRFRPGVLPPVLRTRAIELTDALVDLDAFWQEGSLIDRLHGSQTSDRIDILEDSLRSRIRHSPEPHRAAANACRLIEQTRGGIALDVLCEASGVTSRHLRRLFEELVGIPPKVACRVARFRRAVSWMNGTTALSQVALECGYFDQAHFTREFRTFAGVTPSVYRERNA